MKPEQQNKAIAEACGWKMGKESEASFVNPAKQIEHDRWISPNRIPMRRVPEYCEDLNAMHEAEKIFDSMDYQFKNKYTSTLEDILDAEVLKEDPKCIPDCYGYEQVHATAAQRSEAFLKTLGLWVEEPHPNK